MVEYSSKVASASELGNFSEEGYQFEDVYKDPDAMYQEMQKAGIDQNNMTRLDNINKKTIAANNPRLLREKQLKKLFIQYVRKYISNPSKYLQYPKQIKNLPSWFDEALALFKETELDRSQKRMLREYFYGLLKYRDDKLALSSSGGVVNPEEVNRQLGERSPYSMNEDNLDAMQFPRQQEVKRLDVNRLMRSNEAMNIAKSPDEFGEEVSEQVYPTQDQPQYIPPQTKGRASLGALGISAVRPSNVEDYVAFGRKRAPQTQPAQAAVPHAKMPFVRSRPSQSAGMFAPVDVPTRAGMGVNLTSFIIGGNKPTIAPVKAQQPGYMNEYQQERQPPAWLRASRNPKVRVVRKKKVIVVKPKKKPMIDTNKSMATIGKMFDNIRDISKKQKPKPIGTVNMKVGKVQRKSPKQMSGLEAVRNMDKIFSNIRTDSHKNFGKDNMKLKLVDNIKDQCSRAFERNKFKQEAVNMKKNFFNDVKASYPKMKSEIKEMGNIRENEMMRVGLQDTSGMIQSTKMMRSLRIKRGDMRPDAVGIMDYDFSIDPIRSKPKKKIQLYDEDDFIERGE